MQKVGTIRGIDSFGRVVLPVKLRRKLHLMDRDAVRIWAEDQALVIERVKKSCIFCGSENKVLTAFDGYHICSACLEKIKKL